ncbi:hypothetical protein F5887DRAFT_1277751 [Amanita rubescens]|nr:hypothetical protein F5887DRAFT_1277751 [Amanita rubescens]
MTLHCRDDSVIKEPRRVNQVYQHPNRSTPNLLTEQQSLPQHAPSSNALRSPLLHLLPRHAYFRAQVTVHKVTNIPFVSGTFSARWKFKNVHSAPGAKHKLLGMVKGRSRPGTPLTHLEFPKEDKAGLESDDSSSHTDTAVPAVVVSSFGRSNSFSTRTENRFRRLVSPISASTPRANLAYPAFSPDVKSAGFSPAGFTFSDRAIPLHPDFASPTQPLDPKKSLLHVLTCIQHPNNQRDLTSPARGQTPTAELKDHTVVWNHVINTVLRIDHSTKNDNSQKSKLGVMYLNMSEYVDKGAVERKYLLRESKTNAILKLTIELENIGGDAGYVAPALPRGEIMNGITSLLEKDLYRAGLDKTVDPGSRWRSSLTDPCLPGAPGAKNTEALIDALFNPAITTEKEKESPFTVYSATGGSGISPYSRPCQCQSKKVEPEP